MKEFKINAEPVTYKDLLIDIANLKVGESFKISTRLCTRVFERTI